MNKPTEAAAETANSRPGKTVHKDRFIDLHEYTLSKPGFKEKIAAAPMKPGVYFWKDANRKILYIGKAKILKNRIRSYFNKESKGYRIDAMVMLAADLDWVVTKSEAEALILEDHLIKTHKPKFNIRQKDNKSYPYIKLTKKELFPRLMLSRNLEDRTAVYFGPYKSAFEARKTLETIHKYFPLRKKNLELDGIKKHTPCLNYHMGRCMAPCTGNVSTEAYRETVDQVLKMLKGDYRPLINQLEAKMHRFSEQLKFEEASSVRDRISAIHLTLKKRRMIGAGGISRDVIYIVEDMGLTAVQFLFIRNGAVLSGDFFTYKNEGELSINEIMRSIISRLYIGGKTLIPDELIVSHNLESLEMLQAYSVERRHAKLNIYVPQSGERAHLLDLCRENLTENLRLHVTRKETSKYVLEQARRELNLTNMPNRIECFDISHTSGKDSVASMTVFEDNAPAKKDYRRFKIKHEEGNNDFLSLSEAVERRMKRVESANWSLPDLMVIDGGVGQLSAVMSVLNRFDTGTMDVIAIAKGRTEMQKQPGGTMDDPLSVDYVIKPNRKNHILLKKNSPAAHLIRNIRDEAHRFAVAYHRKLRSKNSLGSLLEEIKGIGKQKQQRLLKVFGGLSQLRDADDDRVLKVKGITGTDLKNIRTFFNSG